jgi:hypothetical protein
MRIPQRPLPQVRILAPVGAHSKPADRSPIGPVGLNGRRSHGMRGIKGIKTREMLRDVLRSGRAKLK